MLPPVRPALDPLAQRAAIDALEAQRAAYRRYARTVDDQTKSVVGGDADGAMTAATVAARGLDELDAGAQALQPHLDRVRQEGSPDQQADVQLRLETLSGDANRAQSAIQNLTAQLDAWRVASKRQLSEVGLTPGSGAGLTTGAGGDSAAGATPTTSTATDPAATGTSRGSDRGAVTPEPGEPRAHDQRGYGPRGQAGVLRPAPTLLNRFG